jgi:CHAD domain-containing protein
MAFRLSQRRSLASELRRHLDRQLRLAGERLREPGTPDADDGIHEARRHIKKARALLRLFAGNLGKDGRAANRRLRTIGRLLGPIADGESVLETLTRLHRRYAGRTARGTRSSLRRNLQRRENRIDAQAREHHVIAAALSLLRDERRHWRRWRGTGNEFRMIAGGLRSTFAAARDRQREASRGFDAEVTHAWRRRVKDQWYQTRLLERRCGTGLARDRRRLGALDDCLGEVQNAAVLLGALRANPALDAYDRGHYRSLLQRYQSGLNRSAAWLGRDIYQEKPNQFVRRIHRLWRAQLRAAPGPAPSRGNRARRGR